MHTMAWTHLENDWEQIYEKGLWWKLRGGKAKETWFGDVGKSFRELKVAK